MSHTTGEDLTGSVTMSLTRYHELMTKAQQADMLPELRERSYKLEHYAAKMEEGLKIAIEQIDTQIGGLMTSRPTEFDESLKYIELKRNGCHQSEKTATG